MFSKSNLLSTLVGAIFLFFGGYLVWEILAGDFFAEHAGSATGVWKETNDLVYVALGCLIEAFFLSTIYGKWANGVHGAKNGFEFGALFGGFTGFGIGFLYYGVANLSDMTGVVAGGIIEMLFMGIAGAIIALVYKSTSK
jgi:hypothetical protein